MCGVCFEACAGRVERVWCVCWGCWGVCGVCVGVCVGVVLGRVWLA